MTEEQERLASVILAAILTAAAVTFAVVAARAMRQTVADHKAFMAGMTERTDHAMWAAEVAAADDAPGEGV
jgi:Spy/CpxP family protein refolding chaperone